ncbi:hypothetical protein G7Y79_00022g051660 [Physcia stellaris]|nr:hypothetical protein G7Y79_00022g051660 [Physcia stellaris]
MLLSASALVLSCTHLISALPSQHPAESSQDPDLKRLNPSAPSLTLSPSRIPTNSSSTNEVPTCWPSTSPPDPPVWPITRPSDCGFAIRLIISEHRALYVLPLPYPLNSSSPILQPVNKHRISSPKPPLPSTNPNTPNPTEPPRMDHPPRLDLFQLRRLPPPRNVPEPRHLLSARGEQGAGRLRQG